MNYTENVRCPKCHKPAVILWTGDYRMDATEIRCPSNCQFTTGELGDYFPKRFEE